MKNQNIQCDGNPISELTFREFCRIVGFDAEIAIEQLYTTGKFSLNGFNFTFETGLNPTSPNWENSVESFLCR